MDSVYENYLDHRRRGCAPKAAAELTGKRHDITDQNEIGELQRSLERIEERDAPQPTRPPFAAHFEEVAA